MKQTVEQETRVRGATWARRAGCVVAAIASFTSGCADLLGVGFTDDVRTIGADGGAGTAGAAGAPGGAGGAGGAGGGAAGKGGAAGVGGGSAGRGGGGGTGGAAGLGGGVAGLGGGGAGEAGTGGAGAAGTGVAGTASGGSPVGGGGGGTADHCAGLGGCGQEAGTSCCASDEVPTTTFNLGRPANIQPDAEDRCGPVIDEVTKCEPDERPSVAKIVQAFSLDRFEVSVGRFRAFLDAYNAWGGPGVGAGASAESSASWQAEWSDALAADRATFAANLQSSECKGADLTPYYTFDDGLSPKRPINCVTWYEAFAFCIWDGGRLPTEAEWELAASGGEERLFPWGSETPTPSRAAFAWTPSPDGPDFLPEVGSRTAGRGRFGHMDLAGSVWEWTSSLEASYSGVIAPSQRRSMRGGSWDGGPKFLRGTYRGFQDPAARFPTVGFRCAREAKP